MNGKWCWKVVTVVSGSDGGTWYMIVIGVHTNTATAGIHLKHKERRHVERARQ